MTIEILCVRARVIPGEGERERKRPSELKFPFSANRNLTLSITPQSPPGSTRAGPRRKSLPMSFTLLFASYLFHFFPLFCSHIFSRRLPSLDRGLSGQRRENIDSPNNNSSSGGSNDAHTHTETTTTTFLVLRFALHQQPPVLLFLLPISFAFRRHVGASLSRRQKRSVWMWRCDQSTAFLLPTSVFLRFISFIPKLF